MQNNFPGYYQPNDKQFKTLWKEGLIILDTSVLLNLYRYSPTTRDQLLAILKDLRDRLWLPHQAAHEFHVNRVKVISDQSKSYTKLREDFETILETIDAKRGHPFISQSLRKNFAKVHTQLTKETNTNITEFNKFLTQDPILGQITDLFESRVSAPFSKEQMESLLKEGEERIKQGIPPGFRDTEKSGVQQYGDFIIWKQILSKAQQDKIAIIFVTDDRKDDWWWKSNGKTIGPAPLLRAEITELSKNLFHMYKPDRFMEMASEYLDKPVKSGVLEEIKETQSTKTHEESEINILKNQQRYSNAPVNDSLISKLVEEEIASSLQADSQYEEFNINNDSIRKKISDDTGDRSQETNESIRQIVDNDAFRRYREAQESIRRLVDNDAFRRHREAQESIKRLVDNDAFRRYREAQESIKRLVDNDVFRRYREAQESIKQMTSITRGNTLAKEQMQQQKEREKAFKQQEETPIRAKNLTKGQNTEIDNVVINKKQEEPEKNP